MAEDSYRVTYTMELRAVSPREAAEEVNRMLRDPDNENLGFNVFHLKTGTEHFINLADEDG